MRPESLELPPLHCSLDSTLGDYYQDFSPSIALVESGYAGGVDARGLPWNSFPGQPRAHSPIRIAQYALANLTAAGRGDERRLEIARTQLDWLVESQEAAGEWAGCWPMTHDNPKYPWLRAPWFSALASGNAISALLRGREALGGERYGEAAAAAYAGLHAPRPAMRICEEADGELWYEEYPASPPLRVLNGHVYCLLGVADHARVSGDPEAHRRWRLAADTLLANLDRYDLGYWSAYELRWREPASLHYQKNIHVPQLRILAALTGEERFAAVADRWETQLRSARSRLRWRLAVRLHARRGGRDRASAAS
jgi:hypothetical protein